MENNCSVTRESYGSLEGGGRRKTGPIGAGEVVELALGGEKDKGNLDVAEDGELLGLLEYAVPALGEAHLAAGDRKSVV